MRFSSRHSRGAFTLVEILVVIGIIALLVSILLPAVSQVRIAAQRAETQSMIQQMDAAIQNYYRDYNAYPGPLSNEQVTGGSSPVAGPGGNITIVENGVLGLVGGYEPNGVGYQEDQVGKGPRSHNPIPSAQKRHEPYIGSSPGKELLAKAGGTTWNQRAFDPHVTSDSYIPEFIDRYSEPLPILYIRANRGRPGITSTDNSAQYNSTMLTGPYKRPVVSGFKGDFLFNAATATTPTEFMNADHYFRDPGVGDINTPATWQVRGKDTYWLISAGKDRRFGTKDDQTNFGGVQ